MKEFELNATQLNQRISGFEQKTKCELIVVVCRKSDPYIQARWRSAFCGMIIFACFSIYFHWFENLIYFFGSNLLSFFIMLFISPLLGIDRYFVFYDEIDRETEEKAKSSFLAFHHQHQLDRSILLFMSLWERKIQILVGQELHQKLAPQDLEQTVQQLIPSFKQGHKTQGILKAVDYLEEQVLIKAPIEKNEHYLNQVQDHIIFI